MALSWYLCVQLTTLAAWPLVFRAFRQLPHRGLFLRRPTGLLLVGLVAWWTSSLGILGNTRGGILIALGVVFLATRFLGSGTPIAQEGASASPWQFLVVNRRWWIGEELLFASCFLIACWLRSLAPALFHTEQPMDLALLSASMLDTIGPVGDPWLAGQSIGYYALGHRLVATLGVLCGTTPEMAYPLGLATLFAFLVSAGFGLGTLLTGPGSGRRNIAGGVLAAWAVAVAGTPTGTRDALLNGLLPGTEAEPWWWFRSTRILSDQSLDGGSIELISETPSFGFLLGDLHAHVIAQPYLLLAAAAAINLLFALRSQGSPLAVGSEAKEALFAALILIAPLIAMNGWDCVAAWPLVVGAWFLGRPPGFRRWAESLGVLALLLTATTLIALPYLLTAQSQAGGPRPNLLHPTQLSGLLWTQGLWIAGALAFLALCGSAKSLKRSAGGILLVGSIAVVCLSLGTVWAQLSTAGRVWWSTLGGDLSPLATALDRWIDHPWTLTLLVCLGGCGVALFNQPTSERSREMDSLLLLCNVGLFTLVLPELLYLDDLFDNRMNTLFKLHGQAWLLLAVVSGCTAVLLWQGRSRWLGGVLATTVILLGLYPVSGWVDRSRQSVGPTRSLDGLAHLSPDERALIAWVRNNVPPRAIVAQAPGTSYHPAESRLSAATGRPTLLGWRGHETQWRGSAYPALTRGREEALETLYRSSSQREFQHALDHWQVDYLLVGPLERRYYRLPDASVLPPLASLTLAFRQGRYEVYRRTVGSGSLSPTGGGTP